VSRRTTRQRTDGRSGVLNAGPGAPAPSRPRHGTFIYGHVGQGAKDLADPRPMRLSHAPMPQTRMAPGSPVPLRFRRRFARQFRETPELRSKSAPPASAPANFLAIRERNEIGGFRIRDVFGLEELLPRLLEKFPSRATQEGAHPAEKAAPFHMYGGHGEGAGGRPKGWSCAFPRLWTRPCHRRFLHTPPRQ
jgi:hypothetical protein